MTASTTRSEHAGTKESLLQRVLFTGPTLTEPLDLYAVVEVGTAVRRRHCVTLRPSSRLSTQTYFGRFPASYYQRWTSVRDVEAVLVVRGTATLRLCASDVYGAPRTLLARATDGSATVRLSASLDRYLDGGSLWVEVESHEGEVDLEDLRFIARTSPRARPTSVVICTYNRVESCLSTLQMLGEDSEVLERLQHVFVVDQGDQNIAAEPGFAAVEQSLGSALRHVRQPNLGGAGGFTRGLFTVMEEGPEDHPHVLLMDDDVALEPETVLRLAVFADHADQPVLVGGQMLYLLHPQRLHRGAEQAVLGELDRRLVPGALQDVDLTQVLPHARVDAGYNGWWCCLIPAEAARLCGLPLPLFLQWDDTEYGVRAARRGVPTVTLPGAGLWHADFDAKDEDWTGYFGIRNALITGAVHGDLRSRTAVVLLGRHLASVLVGMQYGLAATIVAAVRDFLEGPDVLRDGGAQAAADTRRLRAHYPDTERHPPTALSASLGPSVSPPPAPSEPVRPRRALLSRLVAQLRGRVGETSGVPARDNVWWHTSRFGMVVVTDRAQDAVRIRRYDRAVLLRLGAESAAVLLRLAREGDATAAHWQQALPELSSRDNWARLFGLPALRGAGPATHGAAGSDDFGEET